MANTNVKGAFAYDKAHKGNQPNGGMVMTSGLPAGIHDFEVMDVRWSKTNSQQAAMASIATLKMTTWLPVSLIRFHGNEEIGRTGSLEKKGEIITSITFKG